MARRATLRASDADRDQVAERLRQATTEGRLQADELDQRLGAALSARTYGELDRVIADLPLAGPGRLRRRERRGWVRPVLALAIGVPVALAISVAVIAAFTGALAAWGLWLIVAWWFFGGHRRRPYGVRYARRLHHGGCCMTARPPRESFWV